MQLLLDDAMAQQIDVQAEHISGVNNEVADRLSRNLDSKLDWHLAPSAVNNIKRHFRRDFTIDWLASARTTHCARYGTLDRHDSRAAVFNSLHVTWADEFGLAVPPFNLIARVVTKLLNEPDAHGVLVIPNWPSAFWMPMIMMRRHGAPLTLPSSSLQSTGAHPMRDNRSPPLLAVAF